MTVPAGLTAAVLHHRRTILASYLHHCCINLRKKGQIYLFRPRTAPKINLSPFSPLFRAGSNTSGAKAAGNPVVDAEKAALDRIAQNPKGPDLTGKQPGTVLQAQSQLELRGQGRPRRNSHFRWIRQ